MKTSELTGVALDWAVARAEGDELAMKKVQHPERMRFFNAWAPTKYWDQGGPIIERERIDCISDPCGTAGWMGRNYINQELIALYGPTPLIAAMRCYVASKLGDDIEIPTELLGEMK